MLDSLLRRVEQLEKTIYERERERAAHAILYQLEHIIMAAIDSLKALADGLAAGPGALTSAIAAKQATVVALQTELDTANAMIASNEAATQAVVDSMTQTKSAYDVLLAAQS